jgi:leucyl/phenylalanyl-tRNA--protein transferase
MARKAKGNNDPLITPEILLRAYAAGVFPMADSAEDPGLYWVEPDQRGILPLDGFHVARSLRKVVKSERFTIRFDHDFDGVISGCAAPAPERERTWINKRIRGLYGELFALGPCHTVECWQDDMLVGGLYGLALGGAFFGESMFHTVTDASKVALVHLVAGLIAGGFTLLDTQFLTGHLSTFGAREWPRPLYRLRLDAALEVAAQFPMEPMSGREALAVIDAASAASPV